jgi:hypothetical protein
MEDLKQKKPPISIGRIILIAVITTITIRLTSCLLSNFNQDQRQTSYKSETNDSSRYLNEIIDSIGEIGTIQTKQDSISLNKLHYYINNLGDSNRAYVKRFYRVYISYIVSAGKDQQGCLIDYLMAEPKVDCQWSYETNSKFDSLKDYFKYSGINGAKEYFDSIFVDFKLKNPLPKNYKPRDTREEMTKKQDAFISKLKNERSADYQYIFDEEYTQ